MIILHIEKVLFGAKFVLVILLDLSLSVVSQINKIIIIMITVFTDKEHLF